MPETTTLLQIDKRQIKSLLADLHELRNNGTVCCLLQGSATLDILINLLNQMEEITDSTSFPVSVQHADPYPDGVGDGPVRWV